MAQLQPLLLSLLLTLLLLFLRKMRLPLTFRFSWEDKEHLCNGQEHKLLDMQLLLNPFRMLWIRLVMAFRSGTLRLLIRFGVRQCCLSFHALQAVNFSNAAMSLDIACLFEVAMAMLP